jgi:hypothetical protein
MITITDRGEIRSNHLTQVLQEVPHMIRGVIQTDLVRILITDMIAVRLTALHEAAHLMAAVEEDHVQVLQQVPDQMEERGVGIN